MPTSDDYKTLEWKEMWISAISQKIILAIIEHNGDMT